MDLTDEEIKKIEDEWTKEHKVKFTKVLIRGFDFEGNPSLNQYSLLGNLGEGSFGKVKLAKKNETNEKFAIKCFEKSKLK